MKVGEIYKDRYKILQVLKETEEVSVLLAEHLQLQSYWIVKKMNKSVKDNMREFKVLQGVRHENIPLISDVFDEDGYLVIVREYVSGKTLEEYFDEQVKADDNVIGLPGEEIVDIAIKLCEIIQYLHEGLDTPLIFRDIKPANIIISDGNKLKLIDFGIARRFNSSKNCDTEYLGTKGFAAVEQYIGTVQTDERTDSFGIGSSMYYLATGKDLGKPPYRIQPFSEVRKDLPKALEEIILKACSISMDERWQSVKEFKEKLEALVKEEEEDSLLVKRLEEYDNKIISISGIQMGAGGTYAALTLAKEILNYGAKPLIIGCEGDYGSLEYARNSFFSKNLLVFEDIPIMFYEQWMKRRIDRYDFDKYDVIIIDKKELMDMELEAKIIEKVMIGTVSPWTIESFEEELLTPNENTIYLVNHCSEKLFKEIKDSIEDVTMYHVPYKPFEVFTGEDGVYKEMLKEMKVGLIWEREKGFFGQVMSKTGLADRIKR